MMLALRRLLGKVQARLERRVATLSAGRDGASGAAAEAVSAEGGALLLDWIAGELDDHAFIARASVMHDAQAVLEKASVSRPANALVWAARADYCLANGNSSAALEFAERARGLGRIQPKVGLALVKVLAAVGRREDALRALPVALESARHMLDLATRLALCREWQALAPESIDPQVESARAFVAAGDFDAAIAAFERLVEAHGPRTEVLLPLAAVYQDLVRLDDALRVYLQAAEAAPDNVDALCMAGHCARDLGDTALADRCLSRAFELDPGSAFAQYNLGLLRFDQGRIEDAERLLQGTRAVTRGDAWQAGDIAARLAMPVERDVADPDWANARSKLTHDIEQFEYLRARELVGAAIDPVIAEYKAALEDRLLPEDPQHMVALNPLRYPLLARTYKFPVHAPDPAPPAGPLLNPDLDWARLEEQYFDARPSLVTIDNLLSPGTLAALRAYCLESTIWNELKGGYLGAYMHEGFSGRLLLGVAAELRARMPRVIRDHPLQTMWGYKYDARYAGIGVHADVAAVNVNFWLTPDEANLEPGTGGLVVYTHDAPKNWDFRRFNRDSEEIYRYLESAGSEKVTVPYRANRAVIFDSDLFHETDAFHFKPGYENRRVNVTMLYGTRAG